MDRRPPGWLVIDGVPASSFDPGDGGQPIMLSEAFTSVMLAEPSQPEQLEPAPSPAPLPTAALGPADEQTLLQSVAERLDADPGFSGRLAAVIAAWTERFNRDAMAYREATEPPDIGELAGLLAQLRELREQVNRNRARAARQTASVSPAQQVASDPQREVERLARKAMTEEGMELGAAYRLVARDHADLWAQARQAATLSEHPGGRQTWD